jgi:hypothetical protein
MSFVDDFGFDPEKATEFARFALDMDADAIIEVELIPEADIGELKDLLDQDKDGYDRLRAITGRKTGYGAAKAAQSMIQAVTVNEPAPDAGPIYPDDRTPSVSIRAWRGGLPGQGHRR